MEREWCHLHERIQNWRVLGIEVNVIFSKTSTMTLIFVSKFEFL